MKDWDKIIRGLYHSKIKGECILCRIIDGKEEARIVYEDEKVLAFAPLKSGIVAKGHLLLVPKNHSDSMLDAGEEDLGSVMLSARKIANRLVEELDYSGVNLLSANGKAAQQSIQHFHIHLVPRKESDGIDLWPETGYEEKEYGEVYEWIRSVL